ncbi:hypothetical protein ASD62_06355 [Phycicoccus sp. Root563]|uniref:hypothetical protein n=1 Tax=Phycicoccus sp. Root563 TaxID=1736562 RepID=UPI000703C0E6|nr:hypothetical protein [Phycicoccus sp. Root563]KQZ88985.1 hypothetical protein ASD62_06355 [Phycicoccus sp. Root563]
MRNLLGNAAGLAVFVAVCCTALRWLASGIPPRLLRPLLERWEARRARRRVKPEPLPPVLMALEVSRLADHVRYVEHSDLPNKAERLMAARLAYDHTLRDYCRAVDIPVPTAIRGLSTEQRFHMESALIGSGHEW